MDKMISLSEDLTSEINLPSTNTITISTKRYEKLLKAEISLDIVEKMYREDNSFDYDTTLRKIFGKKTAETEGNSNA